jgi:hypothetical protein
VIRFLTKVLTWDLPVAMPWGGKHMRDLIILCRMTILGFLADTVSFIGMLDAQMTS